MMDGGSMPSERESRRAAYVAKARAEVAELARRGLVMAGHTFSSVLFLKGEPNAGEKDGAPPLSGADGTALRKSLAALGYAPEDWVALACTLGSGEPLDPELARLAITTLDPATVIACDEAAANVLREAYADELASLPDFSCAMLAPGVVAVVLGMRFLNLGGFEAALGNPKQKQIMWARLKRVPSLGEPI